MRQGGQPLLQQHLKIARKAPDKYGISTHIESFLLDLSCKELYQQNFQSAI